MAAALFAVQLALNAAWSWLFFGIPPAWGGIHRSRGPVRGHRGDDHRILAEVDDGGHLDAALFGLGRLRHRLELHDLAAEWVNHFSSASTTEVSTCRSEIDQYFFSSRSFSSGVTILKPCFS